MSPKERPILFSASMVRALLANTKTQTRRAIKAPVSVTSFEHFHEERWDRMQGDRRGDTVRCPYGKPGDRLWVREAWRAELTWDSIKPSDIPPEAALWYEADGQQRNNGMGHKFKGKLRPSMFMPRWASRITLEVTDVRVERLQDISEADAQAEGTPCYVCGGHLHGLSEDDCHCFHRKATASDYRSLWESINGEGSWSLNPWVWVVSFHRMEEKNGRS